MLLVKVQKYSEGRGRTVVQRHRRLGERHIPFRTQTLVAVISSDGRVRRIQAVPRPVRAAVEGISVSNRHEFGERLTAVARVGLAKALKVKQS